MLLLSGASRLALVRLLLRFGLDLRVVDNAQEIPGSYWGGSEAGLRGNTLFVRLDTPIHSLLHEAAHFICMTPERRAGLDRDAGGDDAEECAVCYLQILMAGELGIAREETFVDMDAWGYSFRLGSAARWFEEDAADAREWLLAHEVIDTKGQMTGSLRV